MRASVLSNRWNHAETMLDDVVVMHRVDDCHQVVPSPAITSRARRESLSWRVVARAATVVGATSSGTARRPESRGALSVVGEAVRVLSSFGRRRQDNVSPPCPTGSLYAQRPPRTAGVRIVRGGRSLGSR